MSLLADAWGLAWPVRLAWPWLLGLCLVPLARGRRGPADALSRTAALRLPWVPQGRGRGGGVGCPASGGAARAWLWLGWCLLCVALARPQFPGEPVAPPATARQLMLAVDLSGSMNEPDMRLGGRVVTRITAARAVIDDFLSRRAGDHVGLVVFGRQAFVLTPLTPDLAAVRAQLAAAEVGLAGNDTAIGDAIALAVRRLRGQAHGERVLVLLTDGVNTTGHIDPERAAALAAREGVRIHTIAFGGAGGLSLFGLHLPGAAPLMDEEGLAAIARQTGGQAFRARDAGELAGIYARLDRLEPVSVPALPVRPWREGYPPWVLAALACLLLSAWTGRSR